MNGFTAPTVDLSTVGFFVHELFAKPQPLTQQKARHYAGLKCSC